MLVNFLLFQLGWFACVLGAAHGMPWPGVAVAAAVIACHAWRAAAPLRELSLVLLALVAGGLFESTLVAAGLMHYQGGVLLPGTAPVWMLSLWGVFATTLNVSMRWLHGRPALAALLGALGGPLAYLSGARLGAVRLAPGHRTVIVLAIGWAALTPLLCALARRLDGYLPAGTPVADAMPRG